MNWLRQEIKKPPNIILVMVDKKISAIKKFTEKQIGKVLMHKKPSQFSEKAWGLPEYHLNLRYSIQT